MSDIGITLPRWFTLLFIGAQAWPVVAAAFLLAVFRAVLMRGVVRACAIGVALVLGLELAATAVFFPA